MPNGFRRGRDGRSEPRVRPATPPRPYPIDRGRRAPRFSISIAPEPSSCGATTRLAADIRLHRTGPQRTELARERQLTLALRNGADSVLDTTDLSPAELRDELQRRYGGDSDQPVLTIASFGFARGISRTADLVFDLRFLPNPHWVDELRPLTGADSRGSRLSRSANRPGVRQSTASNRFSSTGFPATGPRAKVT